MPKFSAKCGGCQYRKWRVDAAGGINATTILWEDTDPTQSICLSCARFAGLRDYYRPADKVLYPWEFDSLKEANEFRTTMFPSTRGGQEDTE